MDACRPLCFLQMDACLWNVPVEGGQEIRLSALVSHYQKSAIQRFQAGSTFGVLDGYEPKETLKENYLNYK